MIWPFKRDGAEIEAADLLRAVIAASRRPEFYGPGRVADTLEGRFELLTLHAGLVLVRLRAAPEAGAVAQAFVDQLFRHLDAGLREAGVGDLSVPKRMRRLAGEFYGRLEAYAAALGEGDRRALEAAIARNVFPDGQADYAQSLAAHAAALASAHQHVRVSALTQASVWAENAPP